MQTTGIQNIKAISLFYGCAMVKKKTDQGDDITLLKHFFGISACRT